MSLFSVLGTLVVSAVVLWLLGLIPGVEVRIKQLLTGVVVIVCVVVVLAWFLSLFGVIVPVRVR